MEKVQGLKSEVDKLRIQGKDQEKELMELKDRQYHTITLFLDGFKQTIVNSPDLEKHMLNT